VIAPPITAAAWVNTTRPLALEEFRGRVVVLEAFQMLCPGCVSHGIPLAQRIASAFTPDDVVVLGLHTVFEHHAVQGTRAALEAFVHEYGVAFPIAIDAASTNGPIPQTMQHYDFRGTPSLAVIDADGVVRRSTFGHVDELSLGALLGRLLSERDDARVRGARCTSDACGVPET
jgi:peroxiredoxin